MLTKLSLVLALVGCAESKDGSEKAATEDQPVVAASTETKTDVSTETKTEVGESGDEVVIDPPKAIVDADGKTLGLFDATKLTVIIKNDEDQDIKVKLVSLEDGFDKDDFASCTFMSDDCSGQCILPEGKSGFLSASQIYVPGKLRRSFKGGDSTGSSFQAMFSSQLSPGEACKPYEAMSFIVKAGDVRHAPELSTFKLPFRFAE